MDVCLVLTGASKASIFDICSVPIEANIARTDHGVSFDFNDVSSKPGRALNTKRNTLFMSSCGKKKQHSDVR